MERVLPPITISTPPVPKLFLATETASPSPQQSPTTGSGPRPSVAPWSSIPSIPSILNRHLFISGVSEASSSSNSPKQRSNRSEPSTPAEMHPRSIPVPPGGRTMKISPKSPHPPKRLRYQWSMTSSLSGHAGPTDLLFPKQTPPYTPSHALAEKRVSGSKAGGSWCTATSTKVTITFALLGNPPRHITTAIPQERDRRPGDEPKAAVRMVGFEQTPPADELVPFFSFASDFSDE